MLKLFPSVSWTLSLLGVAFASLALATENSEPATGVAAASQKGASKKATVARLSVKGALPESVQAPGMFGELEPNLANLISRLDKAGKDPQISAVLLRIDSPDMGRARGEELRRAIRRLRESKKRVVAELTSASSADYLLAAACDEIVMPPSGTLMLPGVRAEVLYYKGLLDRLGIKAEMMQVGDFKGAAEPYTRTEMSPAYRAQFELVLDDFYDQMVQTIAADRRLEPAKVRELIDQGLFSADQAKEAGLIDTVGYEDQTQTALKGILAAEPVEYVENYGRQKVEDDFSGMMGMMKMFELLTGNTPQQRVSGGKKIAVIHAVGVIMTGEGGFSLLGTSTVGSSTLVKAIREAAADKNVVAIVLRVDSPGGSALASDLIWREVVQLEKPVVASMGDVAASGGYYISMGADKIFAEPGTMTGSIGVVGGKVDLGGLYDKLGLRTEVISRGKNSGLLSFDQPLSDSERAATRTMMETVYQQFLTKAAAGRKREVGELEGLAGGRIWSGRQAKERGLVDELGGLKEALAAAKSMAGLAADDKVELLLLPQPRTFLDQLLEGEPLLQAAFPLRSIMPPALQAPWEDLAPLQQLFSEPAVLIMPYLVRVK